MGARTHVFAIKNSKYFLSVQSSHVASMIIVLFTGNLEEGDDGHIVSGMPRLEGARTKRGLSKKWRMEHGLSKKWRMPAWPSRIKFRCSDH